MGSGPGMEAGLMRTKHMLLIAAVLGEDKQAQYEAEAKAQGISVNDWLQDIVQQNLHLILGEDMGE